MRLTSWSVLLRQRLVGVRRRRRWTDQFLKNQSARTLFSRMPRRAELLEERVLLSSTQTRSFDEIARLMQQQTVTGVTIVTHGFQPPELVSGTGDSLQALSRAIWSKADQLNGSTQASWLLDYDIPSEGATGVFDTTPVFGQSVVPANGSHGTGEVVLQFDWAVESNELNAGWGEAAGDALFAMLIDLGFVDPSGRTDFNTTQSGTQKSVPLHFIAHSFGSVVTSEAVERLARYDVAVDQVTYLDRASAHFGVNRENGCLARQDC